MSDQLSVVKATITSKSGQQEVIQVDIKEGQPPLRSVIESVTELQGKVNEALTKLIEEEKVTAAQSSSSSTNPGGDKVSNQESVKEPENKKPKTE